MKQKLWRLDFDTLALRQVIKEVDNDKAVYFNAPNWLEADKKSVELIKLINKKNEKMYIINSK